MEIKEIMNLISDKRLIEVGDKYTVDKANHKITGAFILKSFVRSSLLGRPISLRTLEEIVPATLELSSLLKTKKVGKNKIDHSSIGKRLKTINTEYFQAIYNELVEKYNSRFNKVERKQLHLFDSTTINLSGRIIKDGLKIGGKKNDSQVKLSVGLKGQIPYNIRFCNDKSEASLTTWQFLILLSPYEQILTSTQDLIPKLPSRSVIVMDNAAFHKNEDLKTMVKKAGHLIEYLPPYSPDLNPIKQKWFQAKSRRNKYHCDIDTLFEKYIM